MGCSLCHTITTSARALTSTLEPAALDGKHTFPKARLPLFMFTSAMMTYASLGHYSGWDHSFDTN